MFFKSLNLQSFIFSYHLLKFLKYLHVVLFLFSFFFCLADSSITFCMDSATQTNCADCNNNIPSAPAPEAKTQSTIMDGMNCHYQVDPFTKQPITNKDGCLAPPVCKTNFGFMMDALRDMALVSQLQKGSSSTS